MTCERPPGSPHRIFIETKMRLDTVIAGPLLLQLGGVRPFLPVGLVYSEKQDRYLRFLDDIS